MDSTPIDQRPTVIKIAIPTQAYFISGIRDFVISLTQNLTGFSEQWAFRFQAVVDELCNNAIEYGSNTGEFIDITFIADRKTLQVIVEDTGTGKTTITAKDITELYARRKKEMTKQYLGIRGRGLPMIVGSWTDELSFEDIEGGGLRVKIKKYLRKEDDEVLSQKKEDPTHLVLK
jgi:anti-sigma regulatory factor (Ser/Thr protein kinase)